jgi:Asp-tRNA(Asn)/Glu-tRNA(Gln) amidotransferase A subunit family amidase
MSPRNVTLDIAVPAEWFADDAPKPIKEAIEKLRARGHQLTPTDLTRHDLVLAPNAHQMSVDLLVHVDDAVSAAKRRKKGTANGS